jgi:cysteine desulfurase/selenocysteine lyase
MAARVQTAGAPAPRPESAATPARDRLLPESLRADFPILQREVDGRPLIYLDSAATAQKPKVVIDALAEHLARRNANVHRGVYPLAREADEAYEGARAAIARFMHAPVRGTIFTKNVTEAINLVAYAWGRSQLQPGEVILTTQMEHHANIVPWQQLCAERSAQLRYLQVDSEGRLDLAQLAHELEAHPVRLVACAHISNVLGTINPVAEIVRLAHSAGALVLIDGAQAAPQLPVDVGAIGADFYAWTGHKLFGPTGIGVLHADPALLEQIEPFLTGGDMIASVKEQCSTWNEVPYKFEAGTPPIAEAVGLAAAVGYLEGITMEAVRAHEEALTEYLLARLGELPGLRIFGPRQAHARGALASFALEQVHPHDIAEIAGAHGVCIRAGHHCAQPLMRLLGVPATARASLALYNRPQEIDALVGALERALAIFAD